MCVFLCFCICLYILVSSFCFIVFYFFFCGFVIACLFFCCFLFIFFFFKQKTAYEMLRSLVGSEMCKETGVFQSGLFGNKTDIATLDNGNEIIFVKSETAGSSIDIDGTITTRQLTETEAASLFPNLTVTAHAVFRVDDTVSDSNKELIGFEGKIENAKVVISTTDIALLDTKIVGSEESSEVNGTSVTAGYFVTDRNSVGEQNVIYYATFKLGDSTVYVENAGAKTESESVKNDLATIIQELINNGALDLSSFNG